MVTVINDILHKLFTKSQKEKPVIHVIEKVENVDFYNESDASDVILSAALGYGYRTLVPFLFTVRKVFKGRLVLIVSTEQEHDLSKIAEHYKVELFVVKPAKKFAPVNERYFFYRDFIKTNKKLKRVFLTDARDVIFQASPFSCNSPHLYLYTEPNSIDKCLINSRWISKLYGDNCVRNLKDSSIICAGTTMGSYELILEYTEIMCEEILKHIRDNKKSTHGDDQAMHNYLFYSGKLPSAVLRAHGESEVQTLHHEKILAFDRECFLLNRNGERVPVIHQYDRFPEFFPVFSNMINRKF